jgi:hypothetical protein
MKIKMKGKRWGWNPSSYGVQCIQKSINFRPTSKRDSSMLFGSYFYVCKKIACCKFKSVHMQADRKKVFITLSLPLNCKPGTKPNNGIGKGKVWRQKRL